MVNDDLLKYIRLQQAHGFKEKEIVSFLKKNGYTHAQIKSHFAYLASHKSYKPLYLIIALVFILILVGGVLYATWKYSQPVCGNGIIEEGETRDTCCIDTGCIGDQTCETNRCVEPTCGECQFERGSVCYDYDCCDDSQCATGESCQKNRCRELSCGYCQYQDGHECASYYCCENNVCNDFDELTTDTCENPGTIDATCINKKKNVTCNFDAQCDDENNLTQNKCQNPGTLQANCVFPLYEVKCEQHEDCDDGDNLTGDFCTLSFECANPLFDPDPCKHGDNICPDGCYWAEDDDCRTYKVFGEEQELNTT